MKIIEGKLNAKGLKFCIVISRFNEFIGKRLLEGAIDSLTRHDAKGSDITQVWVPGAFEIPLATSKMSKSGNYDAIICLGAVIRGETPHFEYVSSEAIKGISTVSLSTGVPVALGIITADNTDQAIERAGTKSGNKGWQAAQSAIEMANLLNSIK